MKTVKCRDCARPMTQNEWDQAIGFFADGVALEEGLQMVWHCGCVSRDRLLLEVAPGSPLDEMLRSIA